MSAPFSQKLKEFFLRVSQSIFSHVLVVENSALSTSDAELHTALFFYQRAKTVQIKLRVRDLLQLFFLFPPRLCLYMRKNSQNVGLCNCLAVFDTLFSPYFVTN